jgi:hypothetical protein
MIRAASAQSLAGDGRTFILSLNRYDNLPDIRLLRRGDGFVISVHTARKALDDLQTLRQSIRDRGGNPDDFKYIVRTYPADLEPPKTGRGSPSFFADASAAEIERLRAGTFAIMFDHEPAWYKHAPGQLPAWRWNYGWSIAQIRTLAHEITERGFRAGSFVSGGAGRRWSRVGDAPAGSFAQLLNRRQTDLSFLIVQAQTFCRKDDVGATYGAFAAGIAREFARVFGAEAGSAAQNAALQVSIDATPSPKYNHVPPEWAEKCLDAATSAMNGLPAIRSFFLWPGRKSRATCEVLMNYRKVPGAGCG